MGSFTSLLSENYSNGGRTLKQAEAQDLSGFSSPHRPFEHCLHKGPIQPEFTSDFHTMEAQDGCKGSANVIGFLVE